MHFLQHQDVRPGVDLIGDTHGYFDEFRALLLKLGYRKKKGVYIHPSGVRTVQLLGDKLDRGNKIVKLVAEQKKMIKHGSAQDLMGNHEYNVRCMYLPHPEKNGALRPRNAKNLDQTKETRKQYRLLKDGGETLRQMLGDAYCTPIYGQNAEYRIVHACWDPKNIAVLDQHLQQGCLTQDLIIHAETKYKETDLSTAIIETLKGKEIKTRRLLDYGFTEEGLKGGRKEYRVAWWENRDDLLVPAGKLILDLPKDLRHKELPVEAIEEFMFDDPDPRPVFFGHYCLREEPHLMGPKYQCLDFGVIKSKGYLTAYRWNFGDKKLQEGRLVWVPRMTLKVV